MNIKKVAMYSAIMMLLFTSHYSFAETLYVNSITTVKGTISNQSISVLDTLEQSGGQDNWSSYVEMSPDNSKFIGTFLFNQPVAKQWQELKLHVNTLGESKNVQRWRFQLRDFTNNSWVTIGDNTGATDWVWLNQTISLTSGINNYINTNGNIKVRYISNNSVDISNIDLMTVELIEQVSTGQWWHPTPTENITWQWQINGVLDTSLAVDMYDVDLFDTSTAQITSLKNSGKIVICYFSAGTYEGWRDDWKQFFPFIVSDSYTGNAAPFAGNMANWEERWLDIRRIDLLEDIMRSRMDLADAKGCDGVEPDNMDAYTNGSETGIALTAQDQLDYNRWIADLAHESGLSVGLKNDVSQLSDLVDYFDWALNEQCFEYNECSGYSVFTNAGKAVFGVEYSGNASTFCPQANGQSLYWLKKNLSLTAWRIGCENY